MGVDVEFKGTNEVLTPYEFIALIYTAFICDKCHVEFYSPDETLETLCNQAKELGWVVSWNGENDCDQLCPNCAGVK